MAEQTPDDPCARPECLHKRAQHAVLAGKCLAVVPARVGSLRPRRCRCSAFAPVVAEHPQMAARRRAMAAGRPVVARRP